jgi:hypothetical protein
VLPTSTVEVLLGLRSPETERAASAGLALALTMVTEAEGGCFESASAGGALIRIRVIPSITSLAAAYRGLLYFFMGLPPLLTLYYRYFKKSAGFGQIQKDAIRQIPERKEVLPGISTSGQERGSGWSAFRPVVVVNPRDSVGARHDFQ